VWHAIPAATRQRRPVRNRWIETTRQGGPRGESCDDARVGLVKSGERVLSTEEVAIRGARIGAGLESLGIGPGDGVAVYLRNDVAFFEISLGAASVGAYPVAVNWHSSEEEARYVFEDSEAKAVVIHWDLFQHVRGAIPAGAHVLIVPTPPEIAAAYGLDAQTQPIPEGAIDWDSWRDGFPPRMLEPSATTLSIIYTSGTTGHPKGVKRPPYTPDQMVSLTETLAVIFGLSYFEDPGQIVTAIVGPIYHSAPNVHALFSYRVGAQVHVCPRFDPEGLLALIEAERITHLHMVPIMFERLLKLPEDVRRRYDISSLCFVVHAAAPCSPATKAAMIDWWGPIIHEYYGATETGPVTFLGSEEWLAHPGSVGRAMEGADVRVIDDEGRILGPGEIGEVAAGSASGNNEFTYHGDPAKRRAADRNGLFAPGDVGYFDEEGYLYLCDRKIDMIISGGVNIYPAAIEAELHKHDAVADCAVFGIPDEEFGEAVHAVVTVRPGEKATEEEIKAFLRERIAAYQVPRQVEFRNELPREDSGKIFKRKLRDPHWAAAGRAI
jgi:long-chain acyl-CoA synthetase